MNPDLLVAEADAILGVGWGSQLQGLRTTLHGDIVTALLAAERRGLDAAAAIADSVANDSGDRAARGFMSTEEKASRGAGRAIAAGIRRLGKPQKKEANEDLTSPPTGLQESVGGR